MIGVNMEDKIRIIGEMSKKKLTNIFKEIIEEKFNYLLDEMNKIRRELFKLKEELLTIKIKLGVNI